MSLLLACRRVFSRKYSVTARFGSGLPSEETSPEAVETVSSTSKVLIDEETVRHLERLSLVDFANKRGIARLEEAIKFADKLDAVDTTGVDPLVSVLENEVLHLRSDRVSEKNDVRIVMSTASMKEEDYYVAPPGNIPLIGRDPNELM